MTTESITRRCNAAERAALIRMSSKDGGHSGYAQIAGSEPALGTLDERLGILVRRLGGRTRPLGAGVDIDPYRVREDAA